MSGGGHRAGVVRSEQHLRIQEELRVLLSELNVDQSRLESSRTFIKVNELGLALENIVAIIWWDGIVVSPEIGATISRLANEMRVDLEALRRRLTQLGLLRRYGMNKLARVMYSSSWAGVR
jgi:hypothetical protein